MKHLFLFLFLLSTCFVNAQEQWYTAYEAGLSIAKETNKKIVLEIGSVINEIPLFIDDEVWESKLVKEQLENYIPISLNLKSDSPLIEKFKLEFSPTLLILDTNENILFKDPGRKDILEVKNILETIHQDYKVNNGLLALYPEGKFSKIGSLLKLDQYLQMSMTGPESMNRYFLKSAQKELELLEINEDKLNDQMTQRYKIFQIAYDMLAYYDLSKQKKLYRIGKKELKSKNHSLLLFYIIMGEELDDDRDKALLVYEELKKRRAKDKQAVEYCYILQKIYDYD